MHADLEEFRRPYMHRIVGRDNPIVEVVPRFDGMGDGRLNIRAGQMAAKRFPPYVFSIAKNALLVHRIARVEVLWWEHWGDLSLRFLRPRQIAHCVCGAIRHLSSDRTRTCRIPEPDALLCGRCHGELPTFGKNGKAKRLGISRAEANVKLGCVVQGY